MERKASFLVTLLFAGAVVATPVDNQQNTSTSVHVNNGKPVTSQVHKAAPNELKTFFDTPIKPLSFAYFDTPPKYFPTDNEKVRIIPIDGDSDADKIHTASLLSKDVQEKIPIGSSPLKDIEKVPEESKKNSETEISSGLKSNQDKAPETPLKTISGTLSPVPDESKKSPIISPSTSTVTSPVTSPSITPVISPNKSVPERNPVPFLPTQSGPQSIPGGFYQNHNWPDRQFGGPPTLSGNWPNRMPGDNLIAGILQGIRDLKLTVGAIEEKVDSVVEKLNPHQTKSMMRKGTEWVKRLWSLGRGGEVIHNADETIDNSGKESGVGSRYN